MGPACIAVDPASEPSGFNRQSCCAAPRTALKVRPSGVIIGERSSSGVVVTRLTAFVAMSYR